MSCALAHGGQELLADFPYEAEQPRRQAPLALLNTRDESPASPLVRLLLLGASRRLDQPGFIETVALRTRCMRC